MKLKVYLIIFFLLISVIGSAQSYTLSGKLTDANSGEDLIGATIVKKGTTQGTITNINGQYSLTVEADTLVVLFSYVGYSTYEKTFVITGNLNFDVELKPNTLDQIEVVGEDLNKIQENTQMSTIDIPVDQIKKIPALLGEVDVVKALQLLPGVQSGSEASSGMYVRGGGPDQNLILLDGTPVYNASHLFGFFSVFNADAIKKVELVKGGFPARYGGRLSSVLDIRMKDGNMKKFSASGNIGLISSKLTIEGPIVKNKASFIVAARRTYIDVLMRPFIAYQNRRLNDNSKTTFGYYFYDLNAKLNWKINQKNRLYFSIYGGDDIFFNRETYTNPIPEGNAFDNNSFQFGLEWGNITSTLRWNKEWSQKLFSNLYLTYSQYQFDIGFEDESTYTQNDTIRNDFSSFSYLSGIEDYAIKYDFDYVPNNNHYIRTGISGIRHQFNTGASAFSVRESAYQVDTTIRAGADPTLAYEYAAYIEDDWKIGALLKVNVGLHYSSFIVGESNYQSVQPRFASRYLLSENSSLKLSYAKMQQNVHLLTNTSVGLPTDLWVPSTDNTTPEVSEQIAIGYARTFNKQYQFSIEAYYKEMKNVIAYVDGASFMNTNDSWEDKIEAGQAWAYGIEWFLQKKKGIWNGWVGYTLAWANRQFPNINFGEKFPYKYDRRHDISIVLSYKISDKWSFAGTWVYGTGNALTLPIVQYPLLRETFYGYYTEMIENFEQRNNFRMEAYHRMDLGFKKTNKHKWGNAEWNFGVYNAYNRRNPFFYYFADNWDPVTGEATRNLTRVSLFPIIPSVSWGFQFK